MKFLSIHNHSDHNKKVTIKSVHQPICRDQFSEQHNFVAASRLSIIHLLTTVCNRPIEHNVVKHVNCVILDAFVSQKLITVLTRMYEWVSMYHRQYCQSMSKTTVYTDTAVKTS